MKAIIVNSGQTGLIPGFEQIRGKRPDILTIATMHGPAAMQQFLREDIPRQIERYGRDTNIFGSNCPMLY